MSAGFYERLSAISTDTGGEDGMTELVVAALGSFGRYYICWKTRSGEYKQESSGLPPPLHQWLFPADGRTRDLATLQVVLGRDDDFFASDRAGKVENKTSTTPDRHPSPSPSASPKPKPLDRASRRRSRTMSLVGPPAGFRLSQSLHGPPIAPISEFPSDAGSARSSISSTRSLSSSGARPSRPPSTFLPALARHDRDRDWKRRPRSIAFGDADDDLAPEPPRKARGSSPPAKSTCCRCGCHAAAAPQPPPPKYVDAGMQTEAPPAPSVPVSPRRRRSFASDCDDSSSSAAETGSSVSRSRRSSGAATDITAASTYGGSAGGNPIVMGEMQNYFRSTGYQLGDALRPQCREPVRYVEVGLVRAWAEVLDRRRTV